MAQVFNPLAAQITMEGLLYGQQYINRFYVTRTDGLPWDVASLDEAAQKAESFFGTDLAPLVVTGLQMTEIRARQMAPDIALQVIRPTGLAGTSPEEPSPNAIAACMTLSTGLAGRSARGRLYVGGIPENATNGNQFTALYVAELNNAFQDGLLSRFANTGTVDMQIVVYSQFTGSAERPVALLTPVTAIGMRDNVVDTQRRRLPGRGR